MANSVTDAPSLRAEDPLEGLAPSEVHYFNRSVKALYAEAPS